MSCAVQTGLRVCPALEVRGDPSGVQVECATSGEAGSLVISTLGHRFELDGPWVSKDAQEKASVWQTRGFPDLPGLRLTFSEAGFVVESDSGGLCIAFWSIRDGKLILSTSMADLDMDLRVIDADAIEEIAALGHVLGTRTAIKGIRRTTPTRAVGYSKSTGVAERQSNVPGLLDAPVVDELDQVVSALGLAGSEDACLELTGGLDSRLLLACRLAMGRPPSFALTFGSVETADCSIAAKLAEISRIPHVIMPFQASRNPDVMDVIHHAQQSGGLIDLPAYASFIPSFRRIADWRVDQIGGGGGELAANFYSPPIRIGSRKSIGLGTLIRRRLIQIPPVIDSHERQAVQDVVERIASAVHERIDSFPDGDQDGRLRRFYLEQRVSNWVGPVINANRLWYQPLTPFLSKEYVGWTNGLSDEARDGRSAQYGLLGKIVDRYELPRGMLEVGFAGPRGSLGKAVSLARKWCRRLRGMDARASFSGMSLEQLLESEAMSEALASSSSLELFGRRVDVERLVSFMNSGSLLGGAILGAVACQVRDIHSPRCSR